MANLDPAVEEFVNAAALAPEVDEVLAQYGQRGVDAELLRPFMEVRAEYVEASIAAAEGEWGSLDTYLRDGLGLTDAARAELQNVYLV